MEIGKTRWIFIVLAAGVFLVAAGGFVQAGDVVIICNPSVKVQALDQDVIRDIFLGRKTMWNDGHRISFVTMKQGEAHEIFVENYVGKTAMQYDTYWKKQVFTGRAMAPRKMTTAREIIDYVAGTDGAIGYVPARAFNEGLNVVRFAKADERTLTPVVASMALHE